MDYAEIALGPSNQEDLSFLLDLRQLYQTPFRPEIASEGSPPFSLAPACSRLARRNLRESRTAGRSLALALGLCPFPFLDQLPKTGALF